MMTTIMNYIIILWFAFVVFKQDYDWIIIMQTESWESEPELWVLKYIEICCVLIAWCWIFDDYMYENDDDDYLHPFKHDDH